jgi:predicted ArsR family transcriptional regulator
VELTSITPSPSGLKALSHPVRLRMLGLLRTEGPATATTLALQLGLNTGATSYHLRQLAQHGFVEDDAGRGNGRDRWWRASAQGTRTDTSQLVTDEDRETYDAYLQAVAVTYTGQLQRAVEERPMLPEPWRRASTMSDWGLRLTPGRARELVDALASLVEGWDEEPDEPGAEDFEVVLQAFPLPGRVTAAEPT